MINKVILIGNLGQDPELTEAQSGMAICKFSVATKEKDKTEWHRIVCFSAIAQNCKKFLGKGSKVYIEGKISYSKYTDKNGVEKNTTDIIANNVTFLSIKDNNGKSDVDVLSNLDVVTNNILNNFDNEISIITGGDNSDELPF